MALTPMTIDFFDSSLNFLGVIDNPEDSYFTRSWYEIGDFSIRININANADYAALLAKGNIVMFNKDPHKAGIIKTVVNEIGEEGKGSQYRTAKGYELKTIFQQRNVYYTNYVDPQYGRMWYMSAPAETLIKDLISDQCGPTSPNSKRKFSALQIATNQARGSNYVVHERGTSLYNVIYNCASAAGIGWYCYLDISNKKIVFDCDLGLDRTASQSTNPWAVFSPDRDTLREASVTDTNDSDYANDIVVAGSTIEHESYSGTEPSDLARFEKWIDQTSVASTDTETELQQLTTIGTTNLTKYSQNYTLDGSPLSYSPLVLGTDYDIGDTVDVNDGTNTYSVKILSAQEAWKQGSYEITLTWGKPTTTITRQVYEAVNRAKGTAVNASSAIITAASAQIDATTALNDLADIASDNVLSAGEKSSVILDVSAITSEQAGIDAQATSYGITTQKTNYDNAVSALTTYLSTLTSPTLWSDTSGNTTIVGTTFRANFQSVYDTRQLLLNAIYAAAKSLADAAQSTANSASKSWTQSSAPTIGTRPNAINGDTWYDSDDGSKYEAIAGNWLLQTSDVPLDPAVYNSMDEVPEIPDDPAGMTYLWGKTSLDGWSANGAGNTIAFSDGKIILTYAAGSGWKPSMGRGFSFSGKQVIIIFSATSAVTGFSGYTGTQEIMGRLINLPNGQYIGILDNFTVTVLDLYFWRDLDIANIITISDVYIGTGAYLLGSPLDNSGHGQHGQAFGVMPVAGISGNGLLGSASAKITFPMTWTNKMTRSFWIKPDAGIINRVIFASCETWGINGDALYVNNTDGAHFIYFVADHAGHSPGGAFTLSVGIWHFIRIVYNGYGSTAQVYADEVLAVTIDLSTLISDPNPTSEYWFYGNGFSSYTGELDEISRYSRALSDQEGLGLYKSKSLPSVYTRAQYLADQAISDGVISPTEKKTIYTLWYSVNGDGASTGSYWVDRNRAIALSLTGSSEYTALSTAYTNLYNYLYTTPGVLATVSWQSSITIVSATYQALWSSYYAAETAMVNKISNQEGVNAISTAGTNVHTLAPKYLGIGILQASGTAAFPGANVNSAGTITTTSTVNPNTGDWMVNYDATHLALGIYYWSGTAWTITSDYKYISDAAIDLCYLANHSPTISVPGFTTYMNAIIINLWLKYGKILTGGSLRGGDRYDETGAVIDGTVPGFFISASGACKVAGISFDGSQGGGVQWTGGQQVGSELNITGMGSPAMAALSGTDIAFIDAENDELRTYHWNGSAWSLLGTGLHITGTQIPSLTALNSTDVVLLDNYNTHLKIYHWNGSIWSLVSPGLSIPNVNITSLTTLNSDTIAFVDDYYHELRTYHWDGSTWSMLGTGLNIPSIGVSSISALNGTDIAFFDSNNHKLRTYHWNGSVWSLLGTELNISGVGYYPSLSALNGTDIAFFDSNTHLRAYRWDGSIWSFIQDNGSINIGISDDSALVALNGTDIVFVDSLNGNLKTYHYYYALSKPWRYPFTGE